MESDQLGFNFSSAKYGGFFLYMAYAERQSQIGIEQELLKWFLTLLISTAGVMGYCVYFEKTQQNTITQIKNNIGSGIFDVTKQMKEKWQFDPDNPIDRQIVEMDAKERFIGIGR